MDRLPEELLEHIISFLDTAPPSAVSGIRAQEPHLDHIFSDLQPLKSLVLVSRTLRRLAGPALYRCLRVSVDDVLPSDRYSPVVASSGPYQLREWADYADGARRMARLIRVDRSSVHLRMEDGRERVLPVGALAPADRHYIDLICDHVGSLASSTHHPSGFLAFIARERLSSRTVGESLVIFDQAESNVESSSVGREARIWMALDRHVDPARVVVLANPSNLARLASCYSDLGDEWAFHIPFQRMEFRRNSANRHVPPMSQQREQNYRDAARLASGSVLFLRYWDSVEYDEGSSLNAYGTYHYFEKRPPSIMNRSSLKMLGLGDWLRHFTYTAVFPHFVHFSAVIDTLHEFRALVGLTLQLAPDIKSTLLDDQERVGRGNMRLQDCWSELEQCYKGVASRLLDVQESPLFMLEHFEPRDYKNQFLRDLLDNIVDDLGPHWVKQVDGTWAKMDIPMLPAPSDVATAGPVLLPGPQEVQEAGVLA